MATVIESRDPSFDGPVRRQTRCLLRLISGTSSWRQRWREIAGRVMRSARLRKARPRIGEEKPNEEISRRVGILADWASVP